MSSAIDDIFNREKCIKQLAKELEMAVKAAADRNEKGFYVDRIGIEHFWITMSDTLTTLAANSVAHQAVRFPVKSDFFPHMAEFYKDLAERAYKQISDDLLRGKTKLWNP